MCVCVCLVDMFVALWREKMTITPQQVHIRFECIVKMLLNATLMICNWGKPRARSMLKQAEIWGGNRCLMT